MGGETKIPRLNGAGGPVQCSRWCVTAGQAWTSKRLNMGIVYVHVVGVVVVFRAKGRTMKQAHSGHAAHTHARTSNSTHEAHQQCLSECDAGHETGPVQCSRWRELNAKAGGARTTREDSQARHKTASPTGSLWNAMVLTRHGPRRNSTR